ncbi:MAG: CRISPR-associated protein Cas4 [Niameybacter sp.]
MTVYDEDDFLLISGIQHFSFCRRQWALIHIEQQWHENLKTVEGEIVHERCHDDKFTEKRKDFLWTRGMRVASTSLGATGQCDVVEFQKAEQGATLAHHKGLWQVRPIEYKRGKTKSIDADRLQLCCQAMCLEEMLCCEITEGYLYYATTHMREKVPLSEALREKVRSIFAEMHTYYQRCYTPKVKLQAGCKSCSLAEICVPLLCKDVSVDSYYAKNLRAEEI